MPNESEEQRRAIDAAQQTMKQCVERSRELVDRARAQLEQLRDATRQQGR